MRRPLWAIRTQGRGADGLEPILELLDLLGQPLDLPLLVEHGLIKPVYGLVLKRQAGLQFNELIVHDI